MQFIKKYPESIILLVFYGFGVNTSIVALTTGTVLTWQYFAGCAILVAITFLYFKVHKRLLEILLALGLLNVINFNVSSLTVGFGITVANAEMNSVGIQPWFLLATTVYVVINRKRIFAKNGNGLKAKQKQESFQRQINVWKERYSHKSESGLRQILANQQNYESEAVCAVEQLLKEKFER